jgi:hypothetical protein
MENGSVACAPSPTPARHPVSPATASETATDPAAATVTPAGTLLASIADGAALLDLDEAGRRLVYVGPAEVTEANVGETLETSACASSPCAATS